MEKIDRVRNQIFKIFALFFFIFAFCSAGAEASSCSFVRVVGVNFGSYDELSSLPLTSTGSITYECSSVTGPITIYLNAGTHSGGSFNPRDLLGPSSSLLAYNLFLDSTYQTIWGGWNRGNTVLWTCYTNCWTKIHDYYLWESSSSSKCSPWILF